MKYPAFQMYPGDWLKDPALGKCSPSTRGIWIDLICAMQENGRTGSISGTITELARIARASWKEMRNAIEELDATQTASVNIENRTQNERAEKSGDVKKQRVENASAEVSASVLNKRVQKSADAKNRGIITITNRRMAREHKTTQLNVNKQDKYRESQRNGEQNGSADNAKSDHSVTEKKPPCYRKVTAPSSSSSSSSTSVVENSPPAPSQIASEPERQDQDWEKFVESGTRAGMRAGPAELGRLRAGPWRRMTETERQDAKTGIQSRMDSGEYADPAWTPTLAVYLRERRWERPLRPQPTLREARAGPPSAVAARIAMLESLEEVADADR